MPPDASQWTVWGGRFACGSGLPRFFQGFVVHVVQQTPFRACCDGFVELLLNVSTSISTQVNGPIACFACRTVFFWAMLSHWAGVVVFDDCGIVQTHAVVSRRRPP